MQIFIQTRVVEKVKHSGTEVPTVSSVRTGFPKLEDRLRDPQPDLLRAESHVVVLKGLFPHIALNVPLVAAVLHGGDLLVGETEHTGFHVPQPILSTRVFSRCKSKGGLCENKQGLVGGGAAFVGVERYSVTLEGAFHYRGVQLLLPCENGYIAVAVPLLHNKAAYLGADKIALAVAVRGAVHGHGFTFAAITAADVPKYVTAVKSQLGSFKTLRLLQHCADGFHALVGSRPRQSAYRPVYCGENRIFARLSVRRRQTYRHAFTLSYHHVQHSVLVGGKAFERVYKDGLSLEISVSRRPCRRLGNVPSAVLVAALGEYPAVLGVYQRDIGGLVTDAFVQPVRAGG